MSKSYLLISKNETYYNNLLHEFTTDICGYLIFNKKKVTTSIMCHWNEYNVGSSLHRTQLDGLARSVGASFS